MSRAAVRKYKTPAATLTTRAPVHGLEFSPAKIDIERCRRSQLNHLRGMNVAARADLLEQLFIRRVVEIQNRERGATFFIPTQRHRRDVDVVFAEQCSDAADDSRTVGIFENENHAVR